MVWTKRSTLLLLGMLQPLWLVVGRALLGSFGWMTFILVTMGIPLLMAPLLLSLLYFFRGDVKASGYVSRREAVPFWTMHSALFLCGFFMMDGGDTEGSVGSVFSHWFGDHLMSISTPLSAFFALVAALAAFVILVDGIRGLRRQGRERARSAPE